jgi:hypothetical protein
MTGRLSALRSPDSWNAVCGGEDKLLNVRGAKTGRLRAVFLGGNVDTSSGTGSVGGAWLSLGDNEPRVGVRSRAQPDDERGAAAGAAQGDLQPPDKAIDDEADG